MQRKKGSFYGALNPQNLSLTLSLSNVGPDLLVFGFTTLFSLQLVAVFKAQSWCPPWARTDLDITCWVLEYEMLSDLQQNMWFAVCCLKTRMLRSSKNQAMMSCHTTQEKQARARGKKKIGQTTINCCIDGFYSTLFNEIAKPWFLSKSKVVNKQKLPLFGCSGSFCPALY